MSNIISCYCLITADKRSKKIFIASTKENDIVLPITTIGSPKFLYNELKYNIQQMFAKNTIQFLEEIIISFIDIQNHHLLNLLDASKNIYADIDMDQDITLLCGVVLHNTILSETLYWIPVENKLMSNQPEKLNATEHVLYYVFDKMIL